MTTENKRDLATDLAICEAAAIHRYNLIPNGKFAAKAFDGWPEAIRRAIAAEEKWARLRAIVYTNATGGHGEDINEYDIISNIMDEIAEDVIAGE